MTDGCVTIVQVRSVLRRPAAFVGRPVAIAGWMSFSPRTGDAWLHDRPDDPDAAPGRVRVAQDEPTVRRRLIGFYIGMDDIPVRRVGGFDSLVLAGTLTDADADDGFVARLTDTAWADLYLSSADTGDPDYPHAPIQTVDRIAFGSPHPLMAPPIPLSTVLADLTAHVGRRVRVRGVMLFRDVRTGRGPTLLMPSTDDRGDPARRATVDSDAAAEIGGIEPLAGLPDVWPDRFVHAIIEGTVVRPGRSGNAAALTDLTQVCVSGGKGPDLSSFRCVDPATGRTPGVPRAADFFPVVDD